MTRRILRQTASFNERLAAFAEGLREEAHALEPGLAKEDLLRRARQADTAAHLDEWANSAGLQPPK